MQPHSQERHIENFDSCFQVIASFMDALQKNFKEDTHYAYPLMPAQANTLFVLDEEVAGKIKSYIATLIIKICNFAEDEFRVSERSPAELGGLHKVRLEFTQGISFDLIRRIMEQTNHLEERILQLRQAQ